MSIQRESGPQMGAPMLPIDTRLTAPAIYHFDRVFTTVETARESLLPQQTLKATETLETVDDADRAIIRGNKESARKPYTIRRKKRWN